jgi:hypothetical protein
MIVDPNKMAEAIAHGMKSQTPEFQAQRDRMLAEWEIKRIQLERIRADEMKLRKDFVAFAFNPARVSGTETLDLPDGRKVKATKILNYFFVSHDENITTLEAVRNAIKELEDMGPEGGFLAERLVRWTPELSIGEYKKLGALRKGAAYKATLDAILETREGTPYLEIVEPRGTVY